MLILQWKGWGEEVPVSHLPGILFLVFPQRARNEQDYSPNVYRQGEAPLVGAAATATAAVPPSLSVAWLEWTPGALPHWSLRGRCHVGGSGASQALDTGPDIYTQLPASC